MGDGRGTRPKNNHPQRWAPTSRCDPGLDPGSMSSRDKAYTSQGRGLFLQAEKIQYVFGIFRFCLK